MNRARIMSLIGLMCCILLLGFKDTALSAAMPVGMVEEINGTVGIKHQGKEQMIKARKGSKIYLHDQIKTAKGAKVKISFINRSSLHLGENAHLIVNKILYESKGSKSNSLFKLLRGKIRAVVEKLGNRDSKFEIETKTAVVGVVGTEFIISAYKYSEEKQDITRVICCKGTVSLKNSDMGVAGNIYLNKLEETWVLTGEVPGEKITLPMMQAEKDKRIQKMPPAMMQDYQIMQGNKKKIDQEELEEIISHTTVTTPQNSVNEMMLEQNKQKNTTPPSDTGEDSDTDDSVGDLDLLQKEISEVIGDINESKDDFLDTMNDAIIEELPAPPSTPGD